MVDNMFNEFRLFQVFKTSISYLFARHIYFPHSSFLTIFRRLPFPSLLESRFNFRQLIAGHGDTPGVVLSL